MRLLYLYGPPAAGKLTIAEAIANQTDFRLFDNHSTLNLARTIYPEYSTRSIGLARKLRLATFAFAAIQDTDLVHTSGFIGDEAGIAYVHDVVQTVEQGGGRVAFVKLYAPIDTLISRADSETREYHKKLTDPGRLRDALSEGDPFATVPYESFELDTSLWQAEECAQLIINRFRLEKCEEHKVTELPASHLDPSFKPE